MAMSGVGIDFPTKEISVGSWSEFTGGMCTSAQYLEVEEVILDLNSSYWGGWVAPMVLQVKSHNILTKVDVRCWIVRGNDKYQMLTCDPHGHQHSQILNIQ